MKTIFAMLLLAVVSVCFAQVPSTPGTLPTAVKMVMDLDTADQVLYVAPKPACSILVDRNVSGMLRMGRGDKFWIPKIQFKAKNDLTRSDIDSCYIKCGRDSITVKYQINIFYDTKEIPIP